MTWAPVPLLVPALVLGAGIVDPGVGPAAPDLISSAPLTASLEDREEDAQADLEKAEAAARKGKHRAAQVGYERLAKEYPDTAAGKVAARRLAIVAELLAEFEPDRSAPLLETALDQAAAEQAWSLAEELLRLQLRLELANGGSGERPRQRLRRLATRVDDQFTLLELEADEPRLNPEQRQQLEQQLRSPREPGGHAALGESPNPEAGASGVDDQP